MSDANPILAEQTRGNFVENRHRGAFVISDAAGRIIASAGDISRPVFPRSAIKSMHTRGPRGCWLQSGSDVESL